MYLSCQVVSIVRKIQIDRLSHSSVSEKISLRLLQNDPTTGALCLNSKECVCFCTDIMYIYTATLAHP